jgi:ABC-2 type transport system ATP-binding protein
MAARLPQPPALQLQDISVRYGAVEALSGASFAVAPGERVALLGPNGAGKSTAVEVVLGLGEADAGSVTVLGTTPRQAINAGRVGAMLQVGGLPNGVMVAEVIDLVRSLQPNPRPLAELLQVADLTDLGCRRASLLSGGQSQRVRLALALAGRPDLLVLDEPTVALDVESRRAFWKVIDDVAQAGTAVLFTTHLLDEADRHAERIVVLSTGAVVADGPPSSIKAATGMRTVRFRADEPSPSLLETLPGVVDLAVRGQEVTLHSSDGDATVRALFTVGLDPHDLEVTGAGLEEALIALTSSSTPTPEPAPVPAAVLATKGF